MHCLGGGFCREMHGIVFPEGLAPIKGIERNGQDSVIVVDFGLRHTVLCAGSGGRSAGAGAEAAPHAHGSGGQHIVRRGKRLRQCFDPLGPQRVRHAPEGEPKRTMAYLEEMCVS